MVTRDTSKAYMITSLALATDSSTEEVEVLASGQGATWETRRARASSLSTAAVAGSTRGRVMSEPLARRRGSSTISIASTCPSSPERRSSSPISVASSSSPERTFHCLDLSTSHQAHLSTSHQAHLSTSHQAGLSTSFQADLSTSHHAHLSTSHQAHPGRPGTASTWSAGQLSGSLANLHLSTSSQHIDLSTSHRATDLSAAATVFRPRPPAEQQWGLGATYDALYPAAAAHPTYGIYEASPAYGAPTQYQSVTPHPLHGVTPHPLHGTTPHPLHGVTPHPHHGATPHPLHGATPHPHHGATPHPHHGAMPLPPRHGAAYTPFPGFLTVEDQLAMMAQAQAPYSSQHLYIQPNPYTANYPTTQVHF